MTDARMLTRTLVPVMSVHYYSAVHGIRREKSGAGKSEIEISASFVTLRLHSTLLVGKSGIFMTVRK